MPPRQAVLGVDLGTQTTKVAVVGVDGEPLAMGSVAVERERPRRGWAQQDPHVLETSVFDAIGAALAAAPRNLELLALGVDGQMGGCIGVDAAFEPVTPYESWMDTRADEDRSEVLAEAGEEIMAAGGIIPFVGPRIRRWLRLEAGLASRLASVVAPVGYVVGRLVGAPASGAVCDRTQANLWGCFDVAANTWSPELAAAVGVPERLLPRIVEPTDIVGGLRPEAARRAGLPAGLPIAAGLGDGTAGWLAGGGVRPGACIDTGGSSEHFAVTVSGFRPDPAGIMTCMPAAAPGLSHIIGFTTGTGLTKRWLVGLVAEGKYERVEAEAARVPPGAGGVVCAPHLHGRVTPFEPRARGAFIGFDEGTTGPALYRALLEAMAFEVHGWVQEALRIVPDTPVEEATAIGGSAASRLQVQVKADVLGLPFARGQSHLIAARGAALVAAVAAGAATLDDGRWHTPGTTIEERIDPDPDRVAAYARLAPVYAGIYTALEPVYAALTDAGGAA